MRRNRRQRALGLVLGAIALAAVAGPVAAAAPEKFVWSDAYTVQHGCGIVEATTISVNEKAFFANGEWVRSVIHFRFDGVYTGPTGKTYANQTNQNAIFTPDRNQISGQGTFLRGAGGVLVHDTGHLVFDPADGSTIMASARALRFDDPNDPAIVEAALCAALG